MASSKTTTRKSTARKSTRGKAKTTRTTRKPDSTPVAVATKVIDLAQVNTNDGFDALRKTMKAKNMEQALKVQGDYFKTAYERSTKSFREIGDIVAKDVRKAVKPYADNVTKTFERVTKRAA